MADPSVNCDEACEVGFSAASAITGKCFTEVKLCRKDRVTTTGGPGNTIKVRGQDVVVNPSLLF